MTDPTLVEWRKSTRSPSQQCVEVAYVVGSGRVWLRDSKCPDGGYLDVTESGFQSFIDSIKAGRRDA